MTTVAKQHVSQSPRQLRARIGSEAAIHQPLHIPEVSTDSSSGEKLRIIIIESRPLVRQCLTQALATASGQSIECYSSVPDLVSCENVEADLVILCAATSGNSCATHDVPALVAQLSQRWPTVVLSDTEDPKRILEAIEKGAKGYIPTSMSLNAMVEALRLVLAGAAYVPADCLLAAGRNGDGIVIQAHTEHGLFTARQSSVVEALRRGKSNKIIAYELNMRESTVKVHVRNIMKKLKAKNRTEVAYIANSLPSKRD
jgi:DNA-binding NarL/FixJ family response regulator